MELTRDFSDTLTEHLQRNRGARKALLAEAIRCLLSGDVDTGKAVLRTYISATIRFEELSVRMRMPPDSLTQMLRPTGNPKAWTLCQLIAELQQAEGVHLQLR